MTTPTPGSHLPRRALRPSHGAGQAVSRARDAARGTRLAPAERGRTLHQRAAVHTSSTRRSTRCFGFSAGKRGGARGSHRGRVLLGNTSAAGLGRPEGSGQRQARKQEERGRTTSHCVCVCFSSDEVCRAATINSPLNKGFVLGEGGGPAMTLHKNAALVSSCRHAEPVRGAAGGGGARGGGGWCERGARALRFERAAVHAPPGTGRGLCVDAARRR